MKKDQIFELEQLLSKVFRKLRHEIYSLIGHEVSPNEFTVLKLLFVKNSLKPSDISKELSVSASHITFVTDALVKKGLVTRQRSEIDRRVVEVAITEKGSLLVNELDDKKSEYFYSKLEKFSDQEIIEFIRLLNKLKNE